MQVCAECHEPKKLHAVVKTIPTVGGILMQKVFYLCRDCCNTSGLKEEENGTSNP